MFRGLSIKISPIKLKYFSSRGKIDRITIKMLQVITYVAQTSTRQERETLVKEEAPGLRRAQLMNLSGLKMQIPPVAPTETSCQVLQIRYAIMVRITYFCILLCCI